VSVWVGLSKLAATKFWFGSRVRLPIAVRSYTALGLPLRPMLEVFTVRNIKDAVNDHIGVEPSESREPDFTECFRCRTSR
jgi:hypothetical protein